MKTVGGPKLTIGYWGGGAPKFSKLDSSHASAINTFSRAPLCYSELQNLLGGGGVSPPPPPVISQATGPISKIQTPFDSRAYELSADSKKLTQGHLMTSQVRSK